MHMALETRTDPLDDADDEDRFIRQAPTTTNLAFCRMRYPQLLNPIKPRTLPLSSFTAPATLPTMSLRSRPSLLMGQGTRKLRYCCEPGVFSWLFLVLETVWIILLRLTL